jgi:hypothetical protein
MGFIASIRHQILARCEGGIDAPDADGIIKVVPDKVD